MKNLLIFLLLIPIGLIGQNKLVVLQSPGSYPDGFSAGLSYEHMESIVYYGAEVYAFPDLNDIPYLHVIGRVGLQPIQFNAFNLNRFDDDIRMYAGIRLGTIRRDNRNHALLGFDCGIDLTVNNWLSVGISPVYDIKADSKVWGNDSFHEVYSTIVKLGIVWD